MTRKQRTLSSTLARGKLTAFPLDVTDIRYVEGLVRKFSCTLLQWKQRIRQPARRAEVAWSLVTKTSTGAQVADKHPPAGKDSSYCDQGGGSGTQPGCAI